jgi:hypothetical protein
VTSAIAAVDGAAAAEVVDPAAMVDPGSVVDPTDVDDAVEESSPHALARRMSPKAMAAGPIR